MDETAVMFTLIIVGFILVLWLALREPKKKETAA
jgi:cbb3-type cytochrome oxidase subunit 3